MADKQYQIYTPAGPAFVSETSENSEMLLATYVKETSPDPAPPPASSGNMLLMFM